MLMALLNVTYLWVDDWQVSLIVFTIRDSLLLKRFNFRLVWDNVTLVTSRGTDTAKTTTT